MKSRNDEAPEACSYKDKADQNKERLEKFIYNWMMGIAESGELIFEITLSVIEVTND